MIYSSGSVAAQKLLFRYTDAKDYHEGNLTPMIADYFDTVNAGPKTEMSSYERIVAAHADRLGAKADSWLFLSDNVKEVEAAKKAGLQSYVVQRPGNQDLSEADRRTHRVISSFAELDLWCDDAPTPIFAVVNTNANNSLIARRQRRICCFIWQSLSQCYLHFFGPQFETPPASGSSSTDVNVLLGGQVAVSPNLSMRLQLPSPVPAQDARDCTLETSSPKPSWFQSILNLEENLN